MKKDKLWLLLRGYSRLSEGYPKKQRMHPGHPCLTVWALRTFERGRAALLT